jgi:hypothetical protein
MFIRGWSRRAASALFLFFLVLLFVQKYGESPEPLPPHPNDDTDTRPTRPPATGQNRPNHPIDDLIGSARRDFERVLAQQSTTLEQAAQRYRERRGRHPPPGFDEWFAAAEKADAIIVEDFFDRIHHDINPLWALDAHDLRSKTHKQPFMIRVRNGKTFTDSPGALTKDEPYRLEMWRKLIREMQPHIPDLDMVVNPMDETRLLVPWETMNEYVEKETKGRRVIDPQDAISKYSSLADVEQITEQYDPGWVTDKPHEYWDFFKLACPPDSLARSLSSGASATDGVDFPNEPPSSYTYKGYVKNFTASQDPCLQPHLRTMHGTFTESLSMSTTHELLPMFGESKLPQNSEFLIPGAVYLEGSKNKYNGKSGLFHWSQKAVPWAQKKNGLYWRGGATGSRNTELNWWHNHRPRFMQMLNSTVVSALEAGDTSAAPTFQLPPSDQYDVPAWKSGQLGKWLSSFVNVAFHDLLCYPEIHTYHWWYGDQVSPTCDWLGQWFAVAEPSAFSEQFDYKYLPDIDGNSFSGRYRAFLFSSSLPLKSAIYTEWHDDRLFPWVHFVPFDNTYMDLYGIMEYFLAGHDAEAAEIAREGQKWSKAVMRREDMRLYVWRLLLEYARVMDPKRDHLAFVDDLREQP